MPINALPRPVSGQFKFFFAGLAFDFKDDVRSSTLQVHRLPFEGLADWRIQIIKRERHEGISTGALDAWTIASTHVPMQFTNGNNQGL